MNRYLYAALYRYGLNPGQHIRKRDLRRYLPDDAVIVEAGAHKGTDTLQFSYLWPNGHIHAFEPLPDLRAIVEGNAVKRSNVTVWPYAVGGQSGEAEFWHVTKGHDGAGSLMKPTGHQRLVPGIEYDEKITVPVVTLEQWADEHNIPVVDAMWLDLQGPELDVLKTAGRVFATTRVLVLEVSYVSLFDGAPLWPEVRDWLTARGFRIVRLVDEGPNFGNVLAVRT